MKKLFAILFILALAVPAFAGRSLEGSYVVLTSPAELVPNTTQTLTFYVYNGSVDTEWIADIHLTFPDGYVLDEASMAFDPPPSGTCVFDMVVLGQTAQWNDGDASYGEIYDGEGTNIYIDVTMPAVIEGEVDWMLYGDIWGDPPHEVGGCIPLSCTPVEEATWTSIKAMYR